MIDYRLLRDRLQVALVDQLGTYTFSNGQTTPAVQIDDGSNPYAEMPAVEGLELMVVPSVRVPVIALYGGYIQTFSGDVLLRQWDKRGTTLLAMSVVLEVLRVEFPELLLGDAERLLRNPKLESLEVFSVQVSQQFMSD